MDTHIVYIGLGSNLGDGPKNLDAALRLLQEQAGDVICTSRYVESEPWGFESAHRFTNAVTAIRTQLDPMQLLDVTQAIERQLGRRKKRKRGEGYADRIIDLDLLLYDDLHIDTERLTIPHPHIDERDFVRLPLEECRQQVRNLISVQSTIVK